MNPDQCSDIRQVQRFIFQHNLYLLSMFQKKIDLLSNSASNSSSKDTRRQHKQANLHAGTIIDCDNFIQDPLKVLARDLTKPIWNCITKVDPKVVYRRDSAMEPIQIIRYLGQVLHSFFSRLKNQHEDESSLKINLQGFEFDKIVQSKEQDINFVEGVRKSTKELFSMLIAAINKQENNMEADMGEDQSSKQRVILQQIKSIFKWYIDKEDQNFNNQIDTFNKIVVSNLNDMINCKIGSLVLCLQPKLMYLPLLLHPMLMGVHSLVKKQLNDILKRQENKANKPVNNINMKEMENQKQKVFMDNSHIYGDITKTQNVSRIVFLNFDGYESEFNLDIAKFMHKSLMYVSFPKQSNSKFQKKEDQQIGRSEDLQSERLLRKYFYGGLSSTQKKKLLQFFKSSQKQLKKNLFIFPLHSRSLSQKYSLPLLYNQQTAFISFIMSEIVYNQISQFNPSLIIISYSQKINLDNQFFVEMMKQLTVLGNYKVVFYANLAKTYLFEQYYSQDRKFRFKDEQQQYFNRHQSHMNMFAGENSSQYSSMSMKNYNHEQMFSFSSSQVNGDILQKMAMMIKISSGTYNLSKNQQTDTFCSSYIQKYKNWKAMSYATPLIKKLSEQFPNLNRAKMRINDSQTICKTMQTYFQNRTDTFLKLISKAVSKYVINLFKDIQTFLQYGQVDFNLQECSQQQNYRRMKIKQDLQKLKEIIQRKFNYSERKQSWNGFKFQKYLHISTQKLQSRYFAHIPKYSNTNNKNNWKLTKKQPQNLICLQFYTLVQKQKIPIQISIFCSKIYYSSTRRHPVALIYIINHLIKPSSTTFSHYFGFITQQFDYKASLKVQVYPFTFEGGPLLTAYETYTQFNYFQTQNFIFMFWPKIFDTRKHILSKYSNTSYLPQSTPYIFRAYRNQPHIFNLIYSTNQNIIPRHGCQCYQIQNTNTVYIFGGFYGDEKNYLYFQTDVTRMHYNGTQIFMENVPKQFYFDYKQLQTNREIKAITKLKNDMVRPKIQYQFLQVPSENQNQMTVFLIGGVGQNFTRPYSMIGHMAHRLTFNPQNGNILSIKRINMHNIIPVNTHTPIKMRSPMQTNILTHSQNRSIGLAVGSASPNSLTIYHNTIKYNAQDQRFQYESQYQFADQNGRNYRQQLVYLKRVFVDSAQYIQIQAKSSSINKSNFIALSLKQQSPKYILQMSLQISLDVKYIHPQLPNYVKLPSPSILSLDINGQLIYALVKHPIYTLDQCLLVMCDLGQLSSRLKDGKLVELHMRQIHKFDNNDDNINIQNNVLIAPNANTVIVVHGQRFKNIQVPQFILKRNRRNYMRVQSILPNQIMNSNSTTHSLNGFKSYDDFYRIAEIQVTNGLSCSIFINLNNGLILCFTFKTIKKVNDGDFVYVILERLDLNADKYLWNKISANKMHFVYSHKNTLKIVQIIQQKQQHMKTVYQLVGMSGGYCLSAKMQIDSNEPVVFRATGQSATEYVKELAKNTKYQHSVCLEKRVAMYEGD